MELRSNSQRNYGIDLLRIVSMFMIVILHSLGHGGALGGAEFMSTNYKLAWLLESAAYCAVNCFALVSGYVGLRSRLKLSSIAVLWLQVLAYHASFTLLWAVLEHRTVDWNLIRDALQPIRKNAYWYYTAYFGISFFTPLLNAAVEHLDRRTLWLCAAGVFVLFSLYPTAAGTDIFKTSGGYHVLWLTVIYFLGAVLRKEPPCPAWGKRVWGLLYLAAVLLSWGMLMLNNHLNAALPDGSFRAINLIQYTSPTIVLAAVSLVMLFSKITPASSARKFIAMVSPLTFGVYLIHDSLFIRKTLISGSLATAAESSAPVMILKILAFAVTVFTACLVIEYLRSAVFKALKIKNLLDSLENAVFQKKNDP